MDQMKQLEVFVKPVNVVFPYVRPYPYCPNWSMTIHTTEGDVGANGTFYQILPAPPLHMEGQAPGGVTREEINAAFESLKKQIARIEEGGRG
jgi:hypothetical protein